MEFKTIAFQIKSTHLEFYAENWKRLRKAGVNCAQWSDLELEIAQRGVGYLGVKNDVKCYITKNKK